MRYLPLLFLTVFILACSQPAPTPDDAVQRLKGLQDLTSERFSRLLEVSPSEVAEGRDPVCHQAYWSALEFGGDMYDTFRLTLEGQAYYGTFADLDKGSEEYAAAMAEYVAQYGHEVRTALTTIEIAVYDAAIQVCE